MTNQLVANRYQLKEVIGGRPDSPIRKAVDIGGRQLFALKFMDHPTQDVPSPVKREAEALTQVKHDNVVRVMDTGSHEGKYYLAMEFLEGQTLMDLLKIQSELPWDRARGILQQVCDGIQAYHENGMYHSDIRPRKIFLVKPEKVKVLPSSVAEIAQTDPSDGLTATGMRRVNLRFAAPELLGAKRNRASHLADIYSVGVTMYRMLCGAVPFSQNDPLQLISSVKSQEPTPLLERRPELGIPDVVDAIVIKALAKDPKQRFQSMKEMGEAIRQA